MSQAIDFPSEELLISRTDPHGRILSANASFVRVSGFSEEELIGAPHKIVRHPLMPRGVFHLMWAEIKAGNPIGAYVRNRAKDGRYYWVFATVSPLADGYISMRIKPSSAGIAMADRWYAELLKREKDEGLSPEASAKALIHLVKAEGYQSYQTFMAERLAFEMRARETALGRKPKQELAHLSSALDTWHGVGSNCESIFDAYTSFGTTPLNMQVQAGHLEGSGAALSKIASNFAGIANDINADLESYREAVAEVAETLHQFLFHDFTQALLSDARTTVAANDPSHETVLQIIMEQQADYHARAAKGLRLVLARLKAFELGSAVIKRQLSGLSVTRVMCAIEIAQIGGDARGNITAIVDELRRFEDHTDKSMSEIESGLLVMGTELRLIDRIEARQMQRAALLAS